MTVPTGAPPRTKRFAVVGSPIVQSRSPEIFAELSAVSGMPLTYERILIEPGAFADVIADARTHYDGWNVTAPHKERALACADDRGAEARIVGAANVLTFRHSRIAAANTDVDGVIALLRSRKIDPRDKVAVVLGAGGAARATVLALCRLGAVRVVVANRTIDRAHALIADLRDACGSTQIVADVVASPAPLIVNATSDGAAVSSAVNACTSDGWCVDLQYKPAETPFVRAAREAGRQAVNGTTMLVAQAIATFRIWYGEDVPLDLDRAHARLTSIVEAS